MLQVTSHYQRRPRIAEIDPQTHCWSPNHTSLENHCWSWSPKPHRFMLDGASDTAKRLLPLWVSSPIPVPTGDIANLFWFWMSRNTAFLQKKLSRQRHVPRIQQQTVLGNWHPNTNTDHLETKWRSEYRGCTMVYPRSLWSGFFTFLKAALLSKNLHWTNLNKGSSPGRFYHCLFVLDRFGKLAM